MLGTDVMAACRAVGIETLGLDLPSFDITRFDVVREHLPEVDRVVNCAAYVRVDDAETQRGQAYAVNAEGAGNVARICSAVGAGAGWASGAGAAGFCSAASRSFMAARRLRRTLPLRSSMPTHLTQI